MKLSLKENDHRQAIELLKRKSIEDRESYENELAILVRSKGIQQMKMSILERRAQRRCEKDSRGKRDEDDGFATSLQFQDYCSDIRRLNDCFLIKIFLMCLIAIVYSGSVPRNYLDSHFVSF